MAAVVVVVVVVVVAGGGGYPHRNFNAVLCQPNENVTTPSRV